LLLMNAMINTVLTTADGWVVFCDGVTHLNLLVLALYLYKSLFVTLSPFLSLLDYSIADYMGFIKWTMRATHPAHVNLLDSITLMPFCIIFGDQYKLWNDGVT
jgi:hypothetical protein